MQLVINLLFLCAHKHHLMYTYTSSIVCVFGEILYGGKKNNHLARNE
jgi:hypothetical protein